MVDELQKNDYAKMVLRNYDPANDDILPALAYFIGSDFKQSTNLIFRFSDKECLWG